PTTPPGHNGAKSARRPSRPCPATLRLRPWGDGARAKTVMTRGDCAYAARRPRRLHAPFPAGEAVVDSSLLRHRWRPTVGRMSDHPPASHHLPLRECFPDVWLASSANAMSIPLGLKITFSRNMVAVRVPDGWVLLNPVRLSEGAEAEVLAKAPLKHAVRLGTFHGRDDRYYVDRFGIEFWGVPGEQTYPEPSFSREITEEGPFPIAGVRVVVFKKATRAECVVCLPQHRLLVTCDSVQHCDHDPLISTLGKLVMYPMGFFTCSCRKQRMFRRASTRGAHPRPSRRVAVRPQSVEPVVFRP